MIELECSNELVVSIILATCITIIIMVGILCATPLFIIGMYCFMALITVIIFNILQ